MTDGMERAVEAAARAMWDVWRQHVIAPSFYREITWDWMLAHPDEHPVSSYLDAARKEAAAALTAALPLVGVEREDVARALFNEAHRDTITTPPANWETAAFEEHRRYYMRLADAVLALYAEGQK